MVRETFLDLMSPLISLQSPLSDVTFNSYVPGVSYSTTGTPATVPQYCVIPSVSGLQLSPSLAISVPRRLLMRVDLPEPVAPIRRTPNSGHSATGSFLNTCAYIRMY